MRWILSCTAQWINLTRYAPPLGSSTCAPLRELTDCRLLVAMDATCGATQAGLLNNAIGLRRPDLWRFFFWFSTELSRELHTKERVPVPTKLTQSVPFDLRWPQFEKHTDHLIFIQKRQCKHQKNRPRVLLRECIFYVRKVSWQNGTRSHFLADHNLC